MAKLVEAVDLGAGLAFDPSVFKPGAPETIDKPEFFDVAERTRVAVETYRSLGLVSDEGAVRDNFEREMQGLYDALVADHPNRDLEVVAFRPVNLAGGFMVRQLLQGFYEGDEQRAQDQGYWPLLDQYTDTEFNTRTVEGSPEFHLGNQALALVLGGNAKGDARLHFAGQNATSQIASVRSAKAAYDASHEHTVQLVTTVADEIILAQQERVLGNPLPHQTSWNRQVQMSEKSAGGLLWRPYVYSYGSDLRVYGLYPYGYDPVGVGVSVGQKPESLSA